MSSRALVRQTLKVSVSMPESVPVKVRPDEVRMLTPLWSSADSSSMNFLSAVDDNVSHVLLKPTAAGLPLYHL